MTWLKFLLCNFFLENTVNCCDVFPHSFSILFLYFLKLYFLIFLIWSWLRIFFCNFFFFKTLFIATVFLRMVFFYDFLWNYLFLFYFLILSWLKITVIICEENTLTFLENYCWLLQCFFSHGFFLFSLCFSLKLSSSILFFKY